MNTSQIRQAFLDFFRRKDHAVERSSPLIPADDPTLLFTTAGMVQFKPYYAWTITPPYLRVATAQKCLRAGGKGSDLENVGRTSRHHTFFEMLGNFAFGDYFKQEAIRWAWEFLTEVIKLPSEKLWASIYLDDEESFEIWNREVGIPADRIVRLGKKDNFWGPAGDSGACGPCSEIYIDLGRSRATVGWDAAPCANPDCKPGCDCDRYLEFWNLVFNQFHQEPDGTQKPLPKTGIDTGMGLERLAMIVQGATSVYETDIFKPLVKAIWEAACGDTPRPMPAPMPRPTEVALNVVADHVRALTFAVADGAVPSNEGRGYVLRRILRRAVRFAKGLGLENPFMFRLVPGVVTQFQGVYPELQERRE
ncbi:MAG: alanine--tRNA ligase, partial [Candidatus Riflebacteria bacterium]|nr:alanine--tRNA ligase [Candidatus Riflebacteria bacterium]